MKDIKIKKGDRFFVMGPYNAWGEHCWFYKINKYKQIFLVKKDGREDLIKHTILEKQQKERIIDAQLYKEVSLHELPFYL